MRSWMIGMVLGILPVGLLPTLPGASGPVCLGLGSLLLLLYRKTPACRFAAGFCLGFALAIQHGHGLLRERLADRCSGEQQVVSGMVSSLPRSSLMRDGTPRQRFELRVDSGLPRVCGKPQRILLSYYGPQEIIPGQRWRFQARLKKPWGLANPGAFNMQAWFASSGIDAVGSVTTGSAVLLSPAGGYAGSVDRIRMAISRRIDSLAIGEGARAVLRAVTVADKSGIDASLWSLFQFYGINHLLVISGLHIGLLAGAGLLLGRVLARPLLLVGRPALWLPASLALMLGIAYAALAGFSVATQRALCMLAAFILAQICGRESTSANNLLLAALVVLVLNPLESLGSGFWLSFSAVAALLWLGRWRRGGGWVYRAVGAHVFMSLVMVPLGGWWFGGSSLIAAPANLLMVPLVGLAVVPVALMAALFFLLGVPVDELLWRLAAWPLERLLPSAAEGASLFGTAVYLRTAPGQTQFCLALISVALWAIPSGPVLRGLAVLCAVPLLLPPVVWEEQVPGLTRVTVLDVGQGTAVVVEAGGRALLYDTGGGHPDGLNMATSVVLPYLFRRGVNELDTLVVSHADNDHSAGMSAILRRLPVARLRYGPGILDAHSGRPCRAGEAWRWPGGQRFQILSPADESGLSSNDASCVLQIDAGGLRLLLPGDIEAARERELIRYWGQNLRSQWLLAGHHGSLTSTSNAWLKHVQPDTVVISSGHGNRFGHPHPAVMGRLDRDGAASAETSRWGALEFEFAPGRETVIRRYRADTRRFWM